MRLTRNLPIESASACRRVCLPNGVRPKRTAVRYGVPKPIQASENPMAGSSGLGEGTAPFSMAAVYAQSELVPVETSPLATEGGDVLRFGDTSPIDTLEKLDEAMAKMVESQKMFAEFTQEQVDHIFHQVALEANMMRLPLAQFAVQETKRGIVEDKVIKNHFASEFVYNKYKDVKTAGIIEEDVVAGLTRIAEPVGPVGGVTPVTNPTSTVIYYCLMALKTRNCIVISPHPAAAKCSYYTAEILRRAAVKLGAPPDCIRCIAAERSVSSAMLTHKDVAFLWATGGPGIVNACYRSGKPAIGVGAGNAPAMVDETCDMRDVAASIVLSKTFDNGMICASENAVVVVESAYEELRRCMEARGCYFMNKEETEKVGGAVINPEHHVSNLVVGKSALEIAELAGIKVPDGTLVLVGEGSKVAVDEPMCYEKLCPVLGLFRAPSFKEGVNVAQQIATNGGLGHTSILYTDPQNVDRIAEFEKAMPTYKVLVDMPSSFGAIGDVYNFRLSPSMSLGCGSKGGSSVSENVGPQHLLNIKHIVERRENMQWFRTPARIYFKRGILAAALSDLKNDTKRCVIVTDKMMVKLGMVDNLKANLNALGIETTVFDDVTPDPTFSCIYAGVNTMKSFEPDTISAFGGGSPMDAAKVMRLLYEHPEVTVNQLTARFMDIRKRVAMFPKLGSKVHTLICMPTTSGTGAEITPFAVLTGDDGRKYPICDYSMTPEMAIVDSTYTMKMPKSLTANTGYDALVHAIESFVSAYSTDYTQALSIRAIKLIMGNLKIAYDNPNDSVAREKMHNASAIAGMAFANAFLGICHSLAHQLGAEFHIPHGLANALMLSHVIRFNATDAPTKMATFSQYKFPMARKQYGEISDHLKLTPFDAPLDAKVDALIARLEELKKEVGIPLSIREAGVSEELFEMKLGTIAAKAFDDQCTGANPRYPLIGELIQLLREAYEGPPRPIQGSSISGSMSMSFSNGNGIHESMESSSEEGQEEHSAV